MVRVHPENLERQHLPAEARGKDVWEERFRAINEWEAHLTTNGVLGYNVIGQITGSRENRRRL